MGIKIGKQSESRRYLVGVFEDENDILEATRAVRSKGLKIADVFTPYEVHGLAPAMGLKTSALPWVSFALGLTGAALKVWFEYWTSAYDWPINVGGKPWDSLPAFIPVTFEVMVLCAGVGTVIAFLFNRRLFPGRKAAIPFEGVTDDRFALVLEQTDTTFDAQKIQTLLEEYRAVHVEERVSQGPA